VNLDVRIKTTAEGQGVKDTAEGLKNIAKEANSAKAATEQVAKATDQIADAAGKTAGATKDAAAAQTGWTISKKQGLDALKKLKDAVPGLGFVIDALKNPYTAITAAIAAFIVEITKQIEKQNELARASLELGQQIDNARGAMDRQKGNYEDLTSAADDYRKKLQQLADEQRGVDATTSQKLAELDRAAKAAESIDKQNLSASEAEIDAQVAGNRMTPQAAASAKRKLKAEYDQRQAERERNTSQSRFAILQEASFQKIEQAAAAEAQIPAAEEEARRLQLAAQKAKAAMPGQRAAAEAQLKEIETQLLKEEAKAASMAEGRGVTGIIPFSEQAVSAQQKVVVGLQSERTQIQNQLANMDLAQVQRESDAKAAVDAVRALQEQSLAGRRAAGTYGQRAVTVRSEQEATDAAAKDLESAKAREETARQLVDAQNQANADQKERDKALVNALKQAGVNARNTKAQVEAQAGR
jgi:hypothetical protein